VAVVQPMTNEEFLAAVRGFTRTAFRWEAQPWYAMAYERPYFEGWLAGSPTPPPEVDWWRPWLERVARWTAEGKTIGRVRVLAEPPTDYQRWLLWAAPWHTQAGEDLRYLSRSVAQQADLPMEEDYWLLDDESAIVLRFDGRGQTTERTLITDPEAVAGYRALRDTAIGLSTTAATAAA
jgi:hypothetical protein